MWLEAILTEGDLQKAVDRFSPLEIRLGQDGRLLLARWTSLSLVADRGIEVICEATLHWPVMGIDVPITMNGLTVLIRPSVDPRPEGEALVFSLELERTGVSSLPLIDDRVTSLVNEELAKRRVELAWTFGRTLSHVFSMPEAILSAESLGLEVRGGKTKVTESALGFAVSFEASVARRGERKAPLPSEIPRRPTALVPAGRSGQGPRPRRVRDLALAAFAVAGATMGIWYVAGRRG